MDLQKNSPHSVFESFIGSMQDVALMRAGKMKEPTIEELFEKIKIWTNEAKEECAKEYVE